MLQSTEPGAGARLGPVVRWFRGRSPRPPAPTITPRSESVAVARVELADLAPEPAVYLGRLGYVTLVLFENLGRAVMAAPTPEAKSGLTRAAGGIGDAHEAVVAELRRLGHDPMAAMEPYRSELDDFQRRTQGADWHEILVTCYLTTGFLLDFSLGLAGGLRADLGDRVSRIIAETDAGEQILVELLRAAVDANPRLASRLAMWGRRLVGDTMLVARESLEIDGVMPGEDRIEPVFTELVAEHTRRMDALGLTA